MWLEYKEVSMSVSRVDEQTQFCAVHTNVEATLRCNKCERWMCIRCAVQTPVGYRCRECVRGLEDKFFTAQPNDYALVATVCAAMGLVGGFLISLFPALFIAIIAGIPFGGLVSEAARRVTARRRGRYTAQVAAGATVLGITGLALLSFVGVRLMPFSLSLLLFAGLAATAVYARFNIWK
jgi:hypothetical protein